MILKFTYIGGLFGQVDIDKTSEAIQIVDEVNNK